MGVQTGRPDPQVSRKQVVAVVGDGYGHRKAARHFRVSPDARLIWSGTARNGAAEGASGLTRRCSRWGRRAGEAAVRAGTRVRPFDGGVSKNTDDVIYFELSMLYCPKKIIIRSVI